MRRRDLFAGASAIAAGSLAGMIPASMGNAAQVAQPGKPKTTYSADAFGAVGDGSTDDTAALQKALDTALAGSSPGLLVIPPGVYRVTRPLSVTLARNKGGVITLTSGISAYGAVIRSEITDGSDVLTIDSQTVARFLLFEGLQIRGRKKEGAGLALHCDGNRHYMYNAALRDVTIEGCGGDGCSMIGNIFESQIFNSYFRDNGANGLTMGHGARGGVLSAIHAFGCVFGGNGRHGVALIRKATDVSFHGCYFLLNGRYGLVAPYGCLLLSHCGFENNHQRAPGFRRGNAGISMNVGGTLVGCTAYSIFNQAHLLRGHINGRLVMIGCDAAGDGKAEGANLARLKGDEKAEITVIGGRGAIEAHDGVEPLEIGRRGIGARFGAAWNSRNQMRLGDYSLWVDSSGALRLKRGAPGSDSDGRRIG